MGEALWGRGGHTMAPAQAPSSSVTGSAVPPLPGLPQTLGALNLDDDLSSSLLLLLLFFVFFFTCVGIVVSPAETRRPFYRCVHRRLFSKMASLSFPAARLRHLLSSTPGGRAPWKKSRTPTSTPSLVELVADSESRARNVNLSWNKYPGPLGSLLL